MKVNEKTGKVVGILKVSDTDDLFVITARGVIIRQPVYQIRLIGRNTQGVKLIKLDPGDLISDITVVPSTPNINDNGGGEQSDSNELIFDNDISNN
jgi:DNA gyrase subunit A